MCVAHAKADSVIMYGRNHRYGALHMLLHLRCIKSECVYCVVLPSFLAQLVCCSRCVSTGALLHHTVKVTLLQSVCHYIQTCAHKLLCCHVLRCRVWCCAVLCCFARFCQQCGVLHPLEDFDGQRKSCRVQLDKHNLRR